MHDLIGMRDEDLSAQELADRDTWLAEHPEVEEEVRFAERLMVALPSLAEAPTAKPATRVAPPWAWAAGGMALAATALVAVGLSVDAGEAGRWKGSGGSPTVGLAVYAEGAGLRELADGASLGPAERLVIRTRLTMPAVLAVFEGIDGSWVVVQEPTEVGAGEHLLGGERPQSWRPDRPADQAVYRAVACPVGVVPRPDGAGCDLAERSLRWTP